MSVSNVKCILINKKQYLSFYLLITYIFSVHIHIHIHIHNDLRVMIRRSMRWLIIAIRASTLIGAHWGPAGTVSWIRPLNSFENCDAGLHIPT